MGIIQAICISEVRGVQKHAIPEADLTPEWGIVGDAHGGNWHRQVSLLGLEKIEAFRAKGADVAYGAFGENLVVDGFDFRTLPVGTLLAVGDVLLQMTQIGKECHNHCAIYKAVGDCIMPREGVFAKVLHGGHIKVGDEMKLIPRAEPLPWQAAVITLSDKGARGEREDKSGPAIVQRLEAEGYEVVEQILLADDAAALKTTLTRLADQRQLDLILTTGGTGFGPRDVTPEATMAVATRLAPGIAEAIRAASLAITPRAMLSRAVSVIRGKTLIVNLPGSEKAARENFEAILPALGHGLEMLRSAGSADCAAKPEKQTAPSLDLWLHEAKASPEGAACGMYLFHNGVVRATAKCTARLGEDAPPVRGMVFDYDEVKAAAAIENARAMPGIRYVRVWLNRGKLAVGDDIMLVLVGGDIRPHVVDALQALVEEIKTYCVTETEQY